MYYTCKRVFCISPSLHYPPAYLLPPPPPPPSLSPSPSLPLSPPSPSLSPSFPSPFLSIAQSPKNRTELHCCSTIIPTVSPSIHCDS